MKVNRRLFASLLMVIMCISASMPAYAANKNSTDEISSDFEIKTVDGVRVPKPSKLLTLKKENNSKIESSSADSFTDTKQVADKLAAAITSMYGSTSIQYALMNNGKIELSGTAGTYSKENDTKLTADTMYGIGSVSKMFVTTAVMKLVDEGEINLDVPVTHYIKDFKMEDGRYKKITVRMLLNHSSGLMGSCFEKTDCLGDNDTNAHDTFLSQLRTQRLKANPGEYSVYCNDGFTLAEILVERVTGETYTTYITKNITNPLSMENTKTPASTFDRARLAKTYFYPLAKALPVEDVNAFGAAGMYSSAENLCSFATTFTKDSNGILSEKSITAIENEEYKKGIWPDAADNTLGYGLGWDSVNMYPFNQYNIKALSKCGDTNLYNSNLTVLPEQNMAVAVVSSGGSSCYDQIMGQEILLEALKEKGIIGEIKPDKTFSTPEQIGVPDEVKKYEGVYESSVGLLDLKINKKGTLVVSHPQMSGKPSYSLFYTKNGTFVSSDGLRSFKFAKETNGKTYLEEIDYENLPYLGQTMSDSYVAQKEVNNKIKASVAKTWEKRNGKKYYPLNYKYSYILYMYGSPAMEVDLSKEFQGYFNLDRIKDGNTAYAFLDGPGQMARDLSDYKFYKKNKVEYLNNDGSLYVEENAIKNLSAKAKFTCKINNNGYASWYNIGAASANKEIEIKLPKKAAYAVYDSEGTMVDYSIVTGNNKVKLPKNGKMVFLGSKKAKFTIKYYKALK